MYKLFNTYTRNSLENEFDSREIVNKNAKMLSYSSYGSICVCDMSTGEVTDIWTDGEHHYKKE